MVTVYITVVLLGIIIISADRMNDDSLESRNTFLKSDKRIKRCN